MSKMKYTFAWKLSWEMLELMKREKAQWFIANVAKRGVGTAHE